MRKLSSVAALALGVVLAPGISRAQSADGGSAPVFPSADGGLSPGLPDVPPESTGLERISIVDAVNRAVSKNPTLATAFTEIDRANALVEQARAGWLPTLTGNAVYTRRDKEAGANGAVFAPKDSFNANLALSVPLFVPKQFLNWGIAKESVAASQATADDTKRLIAVAVGRSYLTILAQHRIVDVDRRAVAAAQAHRDYASARLRGGVGNKVDLVRAEQQLATSLALMETARTNLARAQEALGVLMGENHPFDVLEDVTFSNTPTPQAAEAELKDRRRDLVSLDTRAQVADHVVSNHWADFAPLIGAAFTPFYQTSTTINPQNTGWTATATLTWPIFDGGLRYGQQREREALAREAHLSYEGAERQAHADVRTAFAEVEHADAALLKARDAAQLARQALDLVNLAYRAGATTNIEVIDAERTALDADTQAAVAEDTARQARLDLLAASGRYP